MRFRLKHLLLCLLVAISLLYCITIDGQNVISLSIRAIYKNVGDTIIDDIGIEKVITLKDNDNELNDWKGSYRKVFVSTIMLFTLAMAATTSLGVALFFFVGRQRDKWTGLVKGRQGRGKESE